MPLPFRGLLVPFAAIANAATSTPGADSGVVPSGAGSSSYKYKLDIMSYSVYQRHCTFWPLKAGFLGVSSIICWNELQ